MKIAFRADASTFIGTGHLKRCLSLANTLSTKYKAQCTFVFRKTTEINIADIVTRNGHKAKSINSINRENMVNCESNSHSYLDVTVEQDVTETLSVLEDTLYDWVVTDHYAIDHRWETAIRGSTKRLLVIDDLANRHHNCDLLLDQNFGRKTEHYHGLINPKTQTLIGPHYALLRPEFAALREVSLVRRSDPQLRSLLITMGADLDNLTCLALGALKDFYSHKCKRIVVILGEASPWEQETRLAAKEMRTSTEVFIATSRMANIMACSDLAIGAAGSTALERCCLGLPSIHTILAPNQEFLARSLCEIGAAYLISREYFEEKLLETVSKLCEPSALSAMSNAAGLVCDGEGCERVAKAMLEEKYENFNTV